MDKLKRFIDKIGYDNFDYYSIDDIFGMEQGYMVRFYDINGHDVDSVKITDMREEEIRLAFFEYDKKFVVDTK